ncbi:molecular chaperone TorD family protein [Paeniroseomonas aquatica]|uniref:Molecular chaperone TorD family protein n=2 Tax=Paeniroseomonas aquatica TaxID=373043 RepID=A0ABT8A901_9PROT|nr:molecular chaperone TorD family protein [Paeniroseomonas aquatica]MDN3566118.1 molecular chaperone TorD family protein [Paeniroseomonas aquatica]
MKPAGETEDVVVDPLDSERGRLFALLGRLLAAPPDAALLAGLAALRGDDSALGTALGRLAEAASRADAAAAAREHFALFVGVGRGEVLAYASYYLTGFLHERPLAELRGTLARLGIVRAEGMAEPEDQLGFCCEVMAGLLEGRFGGEPPEAFFARHLAPWAGRCFADIAGAESAAFYRAVGLLGGSVIEIEQAAAALPA